MKLTFDAEINDKMWNVAQHVLNNPKRRTVATKRMDGYVLFMLKGIRVEVEEEESE